MEPVFLTLDEVLEIHAQQIELYGGSEGVRDPAGLEPATATPMATFGGQYLHATIPSMASAYLFHICQNHAFVDGNKRIGAFLFLWFLDAHGLLYRQEGSKRLADNALVALTLLIAESNPTEMDLLCTVVVNLINQENT